ncbi:MAG: TetR/AcrR family transcriptional regulator [Acidobacteriota bacterium]
MRTRTERGESSRQMILERALDLSSCEGLEGLTIGRLAQDLDMSKSGLFAHFGSKEALQLATVEAAARKFKEEVLGSVADTEPGLRRLVAGLEAWISHIEESDYTGGCFFVAAAAEFDDRPGPVRDRIAELSGSWLEWIEKEAHLSRRLGQLEPGADTKQLVFELHAFVQEANWARQLLGKKEAFSRSRLAVRERLSRAATTEGSRILTTSKRRKVVKQPTR